MKSLKELYRVGKGPSSSHTMGPQRAAKLFLERCPNASYYEVTLYGSLAATGKGHMTDVAIEEVLKPHKTVNIIWQPQTFLPYHPNGMKFVGKDLNGDIIDEWTVYSIGGGAISDGTAGKQSYDGARRQIVTTTELVSTLSVRLAELAHLLCRWISYVMYRVMVLLLEEGHLERQDGYQDLRAVSGRPGAVESSHEGRIPYQRRGASQ